MEEIKSNRKDINSKEDSSLKRVGNFIKEARISRNQSVKELASDLKIGEHQLKAIEDGDKDQLPEDVFVKAMVRRISEKLKLDTDLVMDEFNTQRNAVKIEEIVTDVSNQSGNQKKVKKPNPLGFGIVVIFSGIFGLVASSFIFNIFSETLQIQFPEQELLKKN